MGKKKKILYVGPSEKLNGGVASVIRALQSENKKDDLYEVLILPTVMSSKKTLCVFGFILFLIRLIAAILIRRFDLAHIHLASRGSAYRKVIVMIILSFFKKPYLVHLHGGGFDVFYNFAPKWFANLLRYKLAGAECVVALSNKWKDWLCSNLLLQNVRVIANGAIEVKRSPSLLRRDAPAVLFFGGRLEEEKGPRVLLEACAQLRSSLKYQIYFAGDGDIERYVGISKVLGIYEKCVFFGWLDHEAYTEKLNQASIFVLPSFKEGMPMSIIEAMSIGLPIISTSVGGVPELVSHEKTGLLVSAGNSKELTNALERLIQDKEYTEALSTLSYKVYKERFSAENMYLAFQDLYTEFLMENKDTC